MLSLSNQERNNFFTSVFMLFSEILLEYWRCYNWARWLSTHASHLCAWSLRGTGFNIVSSVSTLKFWKSTLIRKLSLLTIYFSPSFLLSSCLHFCVTYLTVSETGLGCDINQIICTSWLTKDNIGITRYMWIERRENYKYAEFCITYRRM